MTSLEAVRIIGEVMAVISAVAGIGFYIVRQIWRVLNAVEDLTAETTALKEHQAAINGKVFEHIKSDEGEFQKINEHLANIEGRMGQQYERASR